MERLEFDNIATYLFVKNGNYLYKIPFRGGWAILKVYYDSRSWFERLYKTFDNIVISGQTSFLPKARLRTEKEAIGIWKAAGFRVFGIYEDIEVAGLPPGGYALYEYVDGRHLHRLLPDGRIPLEERIAVYRKFLGEWHARHRLAIERREPRLIHENGDLKHVMERRGELVWFDFEMCFRSRRHVEDLVARELLAYLKSLGQFLPPDLFELFFRETMEHYPDKALLAHTYAVIFRNRNWILRLARRIDCLRKRSKKPNSKYNMARKIQESLRSESL